LKKVLLFSLVLLLTFSPVSVTHAQQDGSGDLRYIVQPGDTLWTIARKLHVSYQNLLAENNLTEDSSIHPGDALIVPGADSISGVLTTERVPYGESLSTLSDRYQIPEDVLIRLNRLTTPMELYAGVSVVLVADEEGNLSEYRGKRITVREGQSLLEAAVENDTNPWLAVSGGGLRGRWDLLPGEVVRLPGEGDAGPGSFPGKIAGIDYSPNSFVQGNTMVFRLSAPEGAEIEGTFGEYLLHFFPYEDGYVALQGIGAVATPGLRSIAVHGQLDDGTPFAHRQSVRVLGGDYNYVRINARKATARKRWQGKFGVPIPSGYDTPYPLYGDRRSFNGSAYNFYHSGIDYSTWAFDVDIFAAAPGKVVYTGKDSLIYGGVTMIDHGWGVYTVYAHQAEILVQAGQQVEKGQVIGKVGNTGRSTGPHLHWEVWVGGIAVDPLDWLERAYP